jgi:hypothetical protein
MLHDNTCYTPLTRSFKSLGTHIQNGQRRQADGGSSLLVRTFKMDKKIKLMVVQVSCYAHSEWTKTSSWRWFKTLATHIQNGQRHQADVGAMVPTAAQKILWVASVSWGCCPQHPLELSVVPSMSPRTIPKQVLFKQAYICSTNANQWCQQNFFCSYIPAKILIWFTPL